MNILKVAALGAAMILHSQAAELTGKIPVDFKAAGVSAAAGNYILAEHSPGLVVLKTQARTNVAVAMLPVHASVNSTKSSTLTFSRRNDGGYHLTGYCMPSSGCWESSQAARGEQKLEVALMLPR